MKSRGQECRIENTRKGHGEGHKQKTGLTDLLWILFKGAVRQTDQWLFSTSSVRDFRDVLCACVSSGGAVMLMLNGVVVVERRKTLDDDADRGGRTPHFS